MRLTQAGAVFPSVRCESPALGVEESLRDADSEFLGAATGEPHVREHH